ncbi:hypothetical protein BIV57_05175 [Mangrovactinospora gilvigrisea]|uniref:Rossmann fold nucleotide-binding protein n=1 Tax=Mangrovactinospora gilvigrisea TaxID=1428644 RepID=A0A1J7BIU5_9ACTN|nr:hypothetical protein [Mangrovactinospora gilvigrisea]OIV38558.1 hypothetical protein BIV57_05175 [Mangrovactinospora gilvigrisea]
MATHEPAPEITSLAEFDRAIDSGRPLSGCRLRAVDLTSRTFTLLSADTTGTVFLGCTLEPEAEASVRSGGALVLPPQPELPFDPYRSTLYTPDELYRSHGEDRTADARTRAWFLRTAAEGDILAALLRTVHDDAVAAALDGQIDGARVAAVAGSPDIPRGGPGSRYAAAAELGRELARAGLVVATSGGPGAAEAANLGAHLAPRPDGALREALALLTPPAPDDSRALPVDHWAHAAFSVRDRFPGGGPSLGVPSWSDGEDRPTNAFASRVAKFFRSEPARAVLPDRALAGTVFLPGAADTVEELFRAAAANDRRARTAPGPVPLILVGVAHWTTVVPAWPLLESLSAGPALAERVYLVDSVRDAGALLAEPA